MLHVEVSRHSFGELWMLVAAAPRICRRAGWRRERRSGRKIQYARLLAEALDLTRVPGPLDRVLADV
jgi:hypothetical protein